jgi:hypothetical protein
MRDPVEAQLLAYNARDLEAFMDCYTDDCIVEDGDGNRLLTGKAEMRERYAAMFAASPNLHAKILHRIRIGNHVIDEEEITGRVPSFRHAVAIYRLAGEHINHIRFYREAT